MNTKKIEVLKKSIQMLENGAMQQSREYYRNQIASLKQAIKSRDETISNLKKTIEEQNDLMKKDYYKNRIKSLEQQIELTNRQLKLKNIAL